MTTTPPEKPASTEAVPAWVQRLPGQAKRLIKAMGPWLLSQSATASEAYSDHLRRVASAEAFKKGMIAEVEAFANARRKLLERLPKADDAERVRIRNDLKFLEEEARRVRTYLAAFERADTAETETSNQSAADQKEIDPTWLDRFDEFARRLNEPWRADLLSKALAKEAENPGCIGLRALWTIGTMAEKLLHAYSTILDLCANLRGPLVPDTYDAEETIPNCSLGDRVNLSHLNFMLHDLGLIGDWQTSVRYVSEGDIYDVSYGEKHCRLRFKRKHRIRGIIPTDLGMRVGSLYDPKINPMGVKIFDKWLDELGADLADKQELS